MEVEQFLQRSQHAWFGYSPSLSSRLLTQKRLAFYLCQVLGAELDQTKTISNSSRCRSSLPGLPKPPDHRHSVGGVGEARDARRDFVGRTEALPSSVCWETCGNSVRVIILIYFIAKSSHSLKLLKLFNVLWQLNLTQKNSSRCLHVKYF